MTIGEVAHRAQVPASTIRYYERRGLLSADARQSGQRRYRIATLRRLVFIGMMQDTGLGLDEVHGVLHAATAAEWKAIAGQRLAALDEQIAQLQHARELLTTPWLVSGIPIQVPCRSLIGSETSSCVSPDASYWLRCGHARYHGRPGAARLGRADRDARAAPRRRARRGPDSGDRHLRDRPGDHQRRLRVSPARPGTPHHRPRIAGPGGRSRTRDRVQRRRPGGRHRPPT